jgi:pimeloyl-ACP methyl ester carboxylesterase
MGIEQPKKSTNVRSESLPARIALTRLALRAAGGLSQARAAGWAERLFITPRRHPQPLRESEVLAAARPLPLFLDGKPLAAWRWGEGPPVLLVHGWEGRGAQLGGFVDPLVERGLSVIAFDAPAHGRSPGRLATLRDFASAVRAVERAAGGLQAIVAHSFGALGTMVALAEGVAAERVVFVAPASSPQAATERFAAVTGLSPSVLAGVRARLVRRTGLQLDDIEAPRLAARLSSALLVVHDAGDREVPLDEGRRIVAAWPGASLVVTTGLGHRRILWDPSVALDAAEFIAREGRWSAGEPRSAPVQDSFRALHIH